MTVTPLSTEVPLYVGHFQQLPAVQTHLCELLETFVLLDSGQAHVGVQACWRLASFQQ